MSEQNQNESIGGGAVSMISSIFSRLTTRAPPTPLTSANENQLIPPERRKENPDDKPMLPRKIRELEEQERNSLKLLSQQSTEDFSGNAKNDVGPADVPLVLPGVSARDGPVPFGSSSGADYNAVTTRSDVVSLDEGQSTGEDSPSLVEHFKAAGQATAFVSPTIVPKLAPVFKFEEVHSLVAAETESARESSTVRVELEEPVVEDPFELVSELIKYGCSGTVSVLDLQTHLIKSDIGRALGEKIGRDVVGFLHKFVAENSEWVFDQRGGVVRQRHAQQTLSIAQRMSELPATRQVTEVIGRIRQAAVSVFGQYVSVFPFGSSINGFGSQSSDVDLVMRLEQNLAADPRWVLSDQNVIQAFQRHGFTIIESRMNAKVPILRLKYFLVQSRTPSQSFVEIDLSCNNSLPLFNTILLYRYHALCPSVASVAKDVRRWAKQQGIYGALAGHLSSYSFNLMTIFFFQCKGVLPSLQTNCGVEMFETEGRTVHNVATCWRPIHPGMERVGTTLTLQDFLHFYCEEFSWGKTVVSVRLGQMIPIDYFPRLPRKHNMTLIDIEDPVDVDKNLSCHIRNYVVDAVHRAFDVTDKVAGAQLFADLPPTPALSDIGPTGFRRKDRVMFSDDYARDAQLNANRVQQSLVGLPQTILGSGPYGVRVQNADGIFCIPFAHAARAQPVPVKSAPSVPKFSSPSAAPSSRPINHISPPEEDTKPVPPPYSNDKSKDLATFLCQYHPDIAKEELNKLGLKSIKPEELPLPPLLTHDERNRPTPNQRSSTATAHGTHSWYLDKGLDHKQAEDATKWIFNPVRFYYVTTLCFKLSQ